MTLRYGNTGKLSSMVKAMCYAPAGYGKTVLCGTAPAPLIVSAENGLLSLKGKNIPFIEIETIADFQQCYTFVTQAKEAAAFQTVCIDSITDIAESALSALKKEFKDPRQAYGELADTMLIELRKWRHLTGKHVYITCKQARLESPDNGQLQFAPAMPGNVLPNYMPYWGDELMALRIIAGEDGTQRRWLQTGADINYYAKDRSGRLEMYEQPNLTNIFTKITGA